VGNSLCHRSHQRYLLDAPAERLEDDHQMGFPVVGSTYRPISSRELKCDVGNVVKTRGLYVRW
jgi:hypothetical protein